jgi:hypothetical protein
MNSPGESQHARLDQTPALDQENAETSLRLHVFVVMSYRDIPATNNGSERALRPCATFRKITIGLRGQPNLRRPPPFNRRPQSNPSHPRGNAPRGLGFLRLAYTRLMLRKLCNP